MRTCPRPGAKALGLPPYLLALLAVLGLGACGGASPTPFPTDTPPPESPPPPVSLPEDEGGHGAGIEWWYFNGDLAGGAGRQFSFHFVTFQSASAGGAPPQLLQLGLSDHQRGVFLTGEKAGLATAGPTPGAFDVRSSGWEMRGDGVDYELAFDIGGYTLDLRATSRKPAVLHQGSGLASLGPAGDTFYYSRTRLEVSGGMTVDSRLEQVSGTAWMDHQWGEVSGREVGWDWLSLQLDDRTDLMAVLVWDPRDHTPFAAYGTAVGPDGAVRHLEAEDFLLTAMGSWTSPATGAVYPMGWDLTVDPLGLDLTLTPVRPDAEFSSSRFVPAAYWEGAVSAQGTRNGAAISGRGFVELVGYDPRQAEPRRTDPDSSK